MKKKLVVMIMACTLAFGMTGCGFSDGVKDGMKSATEESKKDKSDSKKAESDSKADENVSKEQESDSESQKTESGNMLIDTELNVGDVKNGTGTDKLGEYAYIVIPLENMKNVTDEQYAEFCNKVVKDSEYNWITIDFDNGSGLQFQGSNSSLATYGTIDDEKCIIEQSGIVMVGEDGKYEYSSFN